MGCSLHVGVFLLCVVLSLVVSIEWDIKLCLLTAMDTRRHGQQGALSPSGNVNGSVLCISSYSKTLNR